MNLSASKVDCFLGCEKLYFFRYIQKEYIPPENTYFLIGNIAHKALELFYDKKFHQQPENFKENLSTCLRAALVKYDVMGKLKTNQMVKKDVLNIQAMMKSYLANVLPQPAPMVQYVEKKFSIDVEDFTIAGKADRIDVVDGNYTIVDYKTNGRAFTKKDIDDSVQLPTYKIWLDSLYKKDNPNYKVYGEYVFLKLTSGKKWKSVFEITEDRVENAIEKYRFVQQKLKNGCEFKRNLKYKYCGSMCDYFHLCRKGD